MGKQKFTDNLDEVADKFLAMVADTSMESKARMNRILDNVHADYATSSFYARFLTYISRNRSKDLINSKDELKQSEDEFVRRQEYRNLISVGGMETTSVNFTLMKYQLQELTEYEPENDDNNLSYFFQRLRGQIINKVDEQEKEYQEEQRKIAQVVAENRKEEQRIDREARNLILYKNGEKIDSQTHNKGRAFLITKKDDALNIHWMIPFGNKQRKVPKDSGMQKLTKSINLENLHTGEMVKNLKLALANWLDNTKQSIQIYLASEAKSAPKKNYFLLDPESKKLIWINSLGREMTIETTNYPDLEQWLATNPDFSDPDNLDNLRLLLISVNTERKFSKETTAYANYRIYDSATSLFVCDNATDVRDFQKKDGLYFLFKCDDQWELHLYKDKKFLRCNQERWNNFHKQLVDYQYYSAKSFPEEKIRELRDQLITNNKTTNDTFKYPCQILEKDDLKNIMGNQANSLVLVPDAEQWQVYFIAPDCQLASVALNKLPNSAQKILQSWPTTEQDDSTKKAQFCLTMDDFVPEKTNTCKELGSERISDVEKLLKGPFQKKINEVKKANRVKVPQLDPEKISLVEKLLKKPLQNKINEEKKANRNEKQNNTKQITTHPLPPAGRREWGEQLPKKIKIPPAVALSFHHQDKAPQTSQKVTTPPATSCGSPAGSGLFDGPRPQAAERRQGCEQSPQDMEQRPSLLKNGL